MESYQEPDYKELYFSLFRASEKAIRILIQAQQECEEQVLSAGGGGLLAGIKKEAGIQPPFYFTRNGGQKVRSIRPAIARI